MKNSIVKLTAKELNQVDGGFIHREMIATFVVGLLVGLKFKEVTTATIYSSDFWVKAVGIMKEVSFYTMVSVGTIMAVRKVMRVKYS